MMYTVESKNLGWECPKCGCCYSPATSKCFTCSAISITTTTTAPFPNTPGTGSVGSGSAPSINVGPSVCPNCGGYASAPPLTGCSPYFHYGNYGMAKAGTFKSTDEEVNF